MSEVADGPLIMVVGRSGVNFAIASGTPTSTLLRYTTHVCVRYQRQRTAALRWTGVEEDGAGFGARYLRAGDNGVEVLEFRSRYVRAVHHQRSVESGYPRSVEAGGDSQCA